MAGLISPNGAYAARVENQREYGELRVKQLFSAHTVFLPMLPQLDCPADASDRAVLGSWLVQGGTGPKAGRSACAVLYALLEMTSLVDQDRAWATTNRAWADWSARSSGGSNRCVERSCRTQCSGGLRLCSRGVRSVFSARRS